MTKKSDIIYSMLENYFAQIADQDLLLMGDKYYIVVDSNRRIEISLYSTWAKGEYDAIQLRLLDKFKGEIHNGIFTFGSIFSKGTHIERYEGGYNWSYYKPNSNDITKINQLIDNYVDMWR